MYTARLPHWLRPTPLNMNTLLRMKRFADGMGLHTVCESARCPNRSECFYSGTATFMILGDICTRNCTFCAVRHGAPLPPDLAEPTHLAEAVMRLGLRYVVVTSVTRDDLSDGGAAQFAETIYNLKNIAPDVQVEVLVPDFWGSLAALETIVEAGPAVINHNIETVPRLYHEVRPKASFPRSLELLMNAKKIKPGIVTKSGIIVGLGESTAEVIEVMSKLREAGCDLLTIGQYLRPSSKHHPVVRYVAPSEFKEYESIALSMGFAGVKSGPLVRSSYEAAVTFRAARLLRS